MQKKILVVDDEASIRNVLEIHLKNAGYVVESAATGADGIKRAVEGDFDLMLCDLKLTDMSGLDVIRSVRDKRPNLPVVVVSGFIDAEVIRQAKETGSIEYLRKPFLKNDLLEAVASVFSGAQPIAAK
jgi:two-component system response regulator PilR (NtrC family)